MTYEVGKKVCLWQVEQKRGSSELRVVKEVIVTITETKTGVPGQFSRDPVSLTSLRGVGDDGKTYEKHWESWPESQTNCFTDSWSIREDGEGEEKFWVPKEAVYIYDVVSCRKGPTEFKLMNKDDLPILPKGDIVYCWEHDRYSHKGNECILCRVAKRKTA